MFKWNASVFNRLIEKYGKQEIFKKLNVSIQTIYSWKKGKTRPTIKQLLNICNILNINPASFFTVDGQNDNEINTDIFPIKIDDKEEKFYETKNKEIFSFYISKDTLTLKTYEHDTNAFGGWSVKEKIRLKI